MDHSRAGLVSRRVELSHRTVRRTKRPGRGGGAKHSAASSRRSGYFFFAAFFLAAGFLALDAAFLAMGMYVFGFFRVAGRLRCRPVKSDTGNTIETNVKQTRGEFHTSGNSLTHATFPARAM